MQHLLYILLFKYISLVIKPETQELIFFSSVSFFKSLVLYWQVFPYQPLSVLLFLQQMLRSGAKSVLSVLGIENSHTTILQTENQNLYSDT